MIRETDAIVDRHPDLDILRAFREHRLSGAAVTDVAQHVGRCGQCSKSEATAGRTALDALAGPDQHLSDEEIDVLVDQGVTHPHLETCAMCRAEVEDLRHFDAERPSQRWWIAAAVAFAVLALSAIAVFVRRTTPDVKSVAAAAPGRRAPEAGFPTPAPPKVVASLADGAGRIALRDDGTIAGVDLRSPRDAADARTVLSGGSIAIPAFIATMPGAVRGGSSAAHPPRAIEPFRSAVIDARPHFSWTPVPDARSYRVAVFDANYEEVARSAALTGTSWTPSKALPAGVDLSWHVVAETGAGEISSAGSDRGEAVFRVLTPEQAAEAEAGDGSHLIRGLRYSRLGLLHDAEREFRLLAEQNPGSPIPQRLIASVSR